VELNVNPPADSERDSIVLRAVEPIAVRANEAHRLLGISKRKFSDLTREVPHFWLDGCKLYSVEALRRWALERTEKGKER
jgi:hypothetical protein